MQRLVKSSFEKPCIVAHNVAAQFIAKLDGGHAPNAAQRDQLRQYQTWIGTLKAQVCEFLPATVFRQDDPDLIQAADLLKLIISHKDTAWAAYQADIQQNGLPGADSMRQLHDAVLLCFMFGWLPPVRTTMVTHLKKPNQARSCLQPGCNCPGNYLTWINGSLHATFHHHKTARSNKISGGVITYAIPPDLTAMLQLILSLASRELLECNAELSQTGLCHQDWHRVWQQHMGQLLQQTAQQAR